jgi:hypothetical protein
MAQEIMHLLKEQVMALEEPSRHGDIAAVQDKLDSLFEQAYQTCKAESLTLNNLQREAQVNPQPSLRKYIKISQKRLRDLLVWMTEYQPSGAQYQQLVQTANQNSGIKQQEQEFLRDLKMLSDARTRFANLGNPEHTSMYAELVDTAFNSHIEDLSTRVTSLEGDIRGSSPDVQIELRESQRKLSHYIRDYYSERIRASNLSQVDLEKAKQNYLRRKK